MNSYKHYLNGEYVEENELLISPRDLGFSRGYGVFDYLKTYNEKPFKLKEHIQRLVNSAALIGLNHEYTLDSLTKIVEDTLSLNKDNKEKSIKIILSGGASNSMYQTNQSTLVVIIDELKFKNQEIYDSGIKVNRVKFERYIPEAKTTNYIEGVIHTQSGMKNGAYEPIYYTDKQVHEGSNSNIFVVKDNKIYTPKNNILYGITRSTIISDLGNLFDITEVDFNLDFLLSADEVFLTSSGKEAVPVISIDDSVIGNGKVGPISKIILKEFRKFAERY